jgi:hypothetical protein
MISGQRRTSAIWVASSRLPSAQRFLVRLLAGEHHRHQGAVVGQRRNGQNAHRRRQVDRAQGEQRAQVAGKAREQQLRTQRVPRSMLRQAFIRLTEKAGMHSVVAIVPITGMTFTRAINIQ